MRVQTNVIASIFEKQYQIKVHADFDDLEVQPCELNAFIVQGGTHSTFAWNALIGHIIQTLLPDWQANGYGVDIETELLQHLVWSDNVWLLGKDFNEVRIMFAQLTAKMSDFGVQWKESSLKLMRGGGVDVEPWPAELIKVHERDFKIPWEFTSVVFGSKLNDTGDSDITVEDQLRKAMAAVWKEHVFSSASGSL